MIPGHLDKQYQDIAEYEPCAGAETTPSENREAKGLTQRHLVFECFGPLLSEKQRCFPHGPHNPGGGCWFAFSFNRMITNILRKSERITNPKLVAHSTSTLRSMQPA